MKAVFGWCGLTLLLLLLLGIRGWCGAALLAHTHSLPVWLLLISHGRNFFFLSAEAYRKSYLLFACQCRFLLSTGQGLGSNLSFFSSACFPSEVLKVFRLHSVCRGRLNIAFKQCLVSSNFTVCVCVFCWLSYTLLMQRVSGRKRSPSQKEGFIWYYHPKLTLMLDKVAK